MPNPPFPVFPHWLTLALVLFWIAIACAVTGCASPRRAFEVGTGEGVDVYDVTKAASMWVAADPDLSIAVVSHPVRDGVNVVWGLLPAQQCAEENERTNPPTITLSTNMTRNCRSHLASVIAHELGHYMSDADGHLPCGNIMQADAACGWVEAPTRADVAYLDEAP